MFTDYWDHFTREGLQHGSTHILRYLPKPTKKQRKKAKRKDKHLGFAIPNRGVPERA